MAGDCDSDDLFTKTEHKFDEKNFNIDKVERNYYVPTTKPTNESQIKEKLVLATSVDGQNLFYADSTSCKVKSTDPNDLYRALDITFKDDHSFKDYFSFGGISKFSSIAGLFSAFLGSSEKRLLDKKRNRLEDDKDTKPKM